MFLNESTYPPRKASQPQKRWWQFGLKSVLIAITVFSILMSCAVAPVIPAIGFSIVGMAYVMALVIAATYGKGWIRPYAICALIPTGFSLFLSVSQLPIRWPQEYLVFLLITFLLANIIGFSGAITHGFLSRRSGKVPVPNVWFLRNWLSND